MIKIKPSKFVTLQSYLLVGFGYGAIDLITQKLSTKETKTHLQRNLLYGIVAANFAQIFHIKFNQFVKATNRSQTSKLLLSPFAYIPYYIFAALHDQRNINSVYEQFLNDLQILLPIRLSLDVLRSRGFFFAKSDQINKLQVVCFTLAKFVNASALICVYEKRF